MLLIPKPELCDRVGRMQHFPSVLQIISNQVSQLTFKV